MLYWIQYVVINVVAKFIVCSRSKCILHISGRMNLYYYNCDIFVPISGIRQTTS